MSTESQNENATVMTDENDGLVQDELATLKERADKLGIKYHPSIGVATLREKVNAALEEARPGEVETTSTEEADGGETRAQRIGRLRKEASKLVRIRVTCMNPNKKDWEGEIFTASNAVVGTFKRYVPFNADEGWHVEQIILEQLKQRQCQVFVKKRARGVTTSEGKLIKEFAIEVLPPLTEAEIKDLAQRQAMANGQ